MKRLTLLAFAAALMAGCGTLTDSTSNPTSPSSTGPVNYTAIGASDAIGYGSSNVCFPFTTCPDGQGYVQVIARRFQAAGRPLTMVNLGIPGAVLSPDLQALGNSIGHDIYGNFLTQEVPSVPRDTTLVTIFAGGNDVNTVGAAIDDGLAGADPTAYVQAQIQKFGDDMRTALTGIRARAPNVRIVVLNLPNLAGLPYSSGYSLDKKRWEQRIAVGFSAQINSLTAQGALIVDLMCDPAFYNPSVFSSDGFHPNDAGYAHLADLVYPVVSTGTATAPRSSCAQMTLY